MKNDSAQMQLRPLFTNIHFSDTYLEILNIGNRRTGRTGKWFSCGVEECADLHSSILDVAKSMESKPRGHSSECLAMRIFDRLRFSKGRCLIYCMKCQKIEISSSRRRGAEKKEKEVLLKHGEILTSIEKKHTRFAPVAEMRRRERGVERVQRFASITCQLSVKCYS